MAACISSGPVTKERLPVVNQTTIAGGARPGTTKRATITEYEMLTGKAMSNEDRTHYRKAFKSPYLSSADVVEPITVTVSRVVLKGDETKKSKDSFNTAYFEEKEIRPGEPLKPMILNVHNSEIMRDMCGSPFIDDWAGSVTVYVDKNVRFGRETVEGLRLRAGSMFVSEDQQTVISDLLKEVSADKDAFFKWAGCSSVDRFPASKFNQARQMLEAKRA